MTHWAFRVASMPEVGFGHVSRCAALAAAMTTDVTIYLDPAGDRAAFPPRLSVQREPEPHGCALMLDALAAGRHSAVLFDGPQFGRATIEDVAARAFVAQFVDSGPSDSADVTIRPGLADAVAAQNASQLCGPQFAPLHPAFEKGRERALRRIQPALARRFLVSMGGHDSRNLTGLVISALARSEITVSAAISDSAPHLKAVVELANDVGAELHISPSPEEMMELLLQHDAAIGMAGVSMLERMACGLPSILVGVAANQLPNLSAAARLGAAIVVSPGMVPSAADLRGAAVAFSRDRTLREKIAARGMELVDARGAWRLAEALETALAARLS